MTFSPRLATWASTCDRAPLPMLTWPVETTLSRMAPPADIVTLSPENSSTVPSLSMIRVTRREDTIAAISPLTIAIGAASPKTIAVVAAATPAVVEGVREVVTVDIGLFLASTNMETGRSAQIAARLHGALRPVRLNALLPQVVDH